MTISDIDRLRADADTADVAFEMDEETFRAFYDRTARVGVDVPGAAERRRPGGRRPAAGDLLPLPAGADAVGTRRRIAALYLFRIATNLVRDRHRRAVASPTVPLGDRDVAGAADAAAADRRADLDRAMGKLRPRDRACSGSPMASVSRTPKSPARSASRPAV